MSTDGLFDLQEPDPPKTTPAATAPLAVRMRPRNLDEVVGQAHLLGPGAPLRRLVQGGRAVVDAAVRTARHRQDHPGHAGRRRHRPALRAAVRGVAPASRRSARSSPTPRARLRSTGEQTVLFIDEVHRFSKTQQDSLLGAVEDRTSC